MRAMRLLHRRRAWSTGKYVLDGAGLNKNGQITLEALLAGAMILALLLIALGAISKMHEAQNIMFERSILAKELGMVADYADEICILGDGNSRALPLSPVRLKIGIDGKGRMLSVKSGEWEMKKAVICRARIAGDAPFGREAFLWHEREGEEPVIVISSEPNG